MEESILDGISLKRKMEKMNFSYVEPGYPSLALISSSPWRKKSTARKRTEIMLTGGESCRCRDSELVRIRNK